MKDTQQKPDKDIAEQRYRGPSTVAAAIGEGFIHGKFLLFSGAILGGLAGLAFPTRASKGIEVCRNAVTKWHASENHLVHGIGGFCKWSLEVGESLVGWFSEIGPVEKGLSHLKRNDPHHRVSTAITSGIFASAGLSILGFFTGGGSGARHAIRGRNQFEKAKSEIVSLRTENNRLRDKLLETKFAVDDLKTTEAAKRGTLIVAGDAPPKLAPVSPTDLPPTSDSVFPAKSTGEWADKITAQNHASAEPSLG